MAKPQKNELMFRVILAIVLITALQGVSCSRGDPSDREWINISPGIWKMETGPDTGLSLMTEAQAVPRMKDLSAFTETQFPLAESEIEIRLEEGRFCVRMPLETEEQLFGMGLNFKTVNQRGRILRLHMDHYGGRDNGRTHAPVPFILSSRGYGVLVDTARYIDVYAGTGVTRDSANPPKPRDRNTDPDWNPRPESDNLEILVPGEHLRIILFAGDSMMDVLRRFNLFCGGGFIPPKWGLGFWQRTPTLYSSGEVKKEVEDFASKGFPLDVIGLEPGWHSKSYPCTFSWDQGRFPDPKGFIEEMAGMGIKVNLWMNPYLSPESPLYRDMLPYSGTHTVWNGIVPDYSTPEAVKIMKDHLQKELVGLGVSGFKTDEIDGFDYWLWPDTARFPSGKTGEEARQTYCLNLLDLIDETYREEGLRTYGLTRAANAGAVRFPYVIYNDYYSHPDFITALINSGFIGVLWTPEVRSGGSAEDWLRRMQTVCFSPLAMINAWADGTKPWSYPEVYEECRQAAQLRMRLLPYFYSVFADYYFRGTPPFYSLNLLEDFYYVSKGEGEAGTTEIDSTSNPYAESIRHEIKDQYMAGPSLMIAPLFAGQSERDVLLPGGSWYDFYTGEYAGSSEVIRVSPGLERIPVFVKDGGIIPMLGKPIRNTLEWQGQDLEIRVYGNAPGTFPLYDDDGNTYSYEEGDYTICRLHTSSGENGGLQGSREFETKSNHWPYAESVWRFMTEESSGK